jgi:hypothetical protein
MLFIGLIKPDYPSVAWCIYLRPELSPYLVLFKAPLIALGPYTIAAVCKLSNTSGSITLLSSEFYIP